MADKNDPKELNDLARGLQGMMTKVDTLVSHVAATFDLITDKVKNTVTNVKTWKDQLENLQNLNKSYAQTLEDTLKNERAKTLAIKSGLDVEVAALIVAKQQGIAAAIQEGASLKELHNLKQQFDQAIQYTKEKLKQKQLQDQELVIADKIKKYDKEREEALEGISAKSKVLKDIITDQRVAAAIFTNQLFKGFNTTKELFAEVRQEGFTVSQAFHETGQAMSDAFTLGGTSAKDSLEVMKGMRSEMGSLEKVTSDARREAASLAKTFGISAEQAGQITAQFATMPGATLESANNTLEFAGNLAKAAHVAPGEVMAEIAQNSEDVAVYTKNGGQNIATAAVAAKKLGVEFGTITKATERLLDFENSINDQMEASVLLGREINLDKAREAALNGDLVGATQEMLKNVGGEAEFNRMNVLQRKALAESMGVSVQDLAKMVKHQDELANLTEEQQEALATGETSLDEALANAGGLSNKLYEGVVSIGSMVGGFGSFVSGVKEGVGAAKELASSFMNMASKIFPSLAAGMSKLGGGIKSKLGGGDMSKQVAEGEKATTASSKMKGGGGFAKSMKGVASGLKAMGTAQVTLGILNLALAGPALIVALLGIPFLALIAAIGIPIGIGLKGLAKGLSALADPLVAAGVGILSLLVLSVGAGMMMFGIGVGVAAAGMSLLVTSLQNVPFENLIAMPIALMGIATGLGMMAVAGLAALPVIGALTALAVVAPALVGLGAAMSGMFGGGGKEEDKMDTLIGEIRELKVIASKGGEIKMDGKKVGDVLRLGLNTSNVR